MRAFYTHNTSTKGKLLIRLAMVNNDGMLLFLLSTSIKLTEIALSYENSLVVYTFHIILSAEPWTMVVTLLGQICGFIC